MANTLTLPALDPVSKQPEFKHSAVRIEAAHFNWSGALIRLLDQPELILAAQQWARHFSFATVARIGQSEREAVLLRFAGDNMPSPDSIARLDEDLGFNEAAYLDYGDVKRGVSKRMLLKDGRLIGARLIGEDGTQDWLQTLILGGEDVSTFRHLLFAPKVPKNLAPVQQGRMVCNCMQISETAIRTAIQVGAASVEAIGAACGAGTQCGSCKPELAQMLRS